MSLIWSYGVTSVDSRANTLLQPTLVSLAKAGFDRPRVFIDNARSYPDWLQGYEVVTRGERIRTFGNWVLALWELYLREPNADRYAIFQDDMVASKNLRQYLEQLPYPSKGYINLYTFPQNEKQFKGLYLSNQCGLGAVGLVFDNQAARVLLASQHMVNRPMDSERGHRSIDGGIVTAFRNAGWNEYVHNPSLIQHTGDESSMGNGRHQKAATFMGEEFDCLSLAPTVTSGPVPSRAMRIGLVGYNTATGLGELNRQIAHYLEPNAWLIKPHARFGNLPAPTDLDVYVCPTGNPTKLKLFLRQCDVVVFCETPYYSNLIPMARALKKRIVCVPMLEWMTPGCKGWPTLVDLHLCPTKQSYDVFSHVIPCRQIVWPVDTARFQFKERTTCERFLFVNGRGGYNGRKGLAVIEEVLKLWPEAPIVYRSQVPINGLNCQQLPAVESNADLYAEGDVLICPHSVDGLGLEPREAMACGMPVITTDGKPWNEIPAIHRIKATFKRAVVQRPVDWYLPDAADLVAAMKRLLGSTIKEESYQARQWAENRSWSYLRDHLHDSITHGISGIPLIPEAPLESAR